MLKPRPIMKSCMPGESMVVRERPPRKVITAIFKLLDDPENFQCSILFKLIKELRKSLMYFWGNPAQDKRCAEIGLVQYKQDTEESIQLLERTNDGIERKLKWGGCRVHHLYHVAAMLLNGRESAEILNLVEQMKDEKADNILTRIGNLSISTDGTKLKSKVSYSQNY